MSALRGVTLTAVSAFIAAAGASCVPGAAREGVLGRPVRVLPEQRGPLVTGELLAVGVDTLWLLTRTGMQAIPRDAVRGVYVERHGFGARKAVIWAAAGGVITAGAITAACASEGEDCAAVFANVMLVWGLAGTLAAGSADVSRWMAVVPDEWDALRSYARFPQGLPAAFAP